MYLKTLTIKGFKSFADRTMLQFEPGVTVAVGPNGSGKSNITDAVLWVLGEQSAISLRGSAMEDVIFAGSQARPSAGLAEVNLVLDNSDHILPIEFSEVSITRRISRVGDSEYLINNSPCRLLDVQELLMNSGLGKEMYSIVSQGKLEQILASKPEERRLLIEEASGVLKHRIRKERAMRKLVSMDQNLVRAKDILKEINRQIQPLEGQAQKAQDYGKLAKRLGDLEISLNVKHLEKIQDEWAELAANESNWEKSLEELKTRIAGEDEKREDLRVSKEKEQARLMRLEEKKRRFQTCLDRLSNTLLLAEEKGRSLTARKDELHQKVEQLEQRVNRREQESLDLRERKDSFLQRKEEIAQKLEALEEKLKEIKIEEARLSNELGKAEGQRTEAAKMHSQKEGELQSLRSNIENCELKSTLIRSKDDSCLARIKEAQENLKKVKDQFLEERKECARWGKEKQLLDEKIAQEDKEADRLKLKSEEIKEKLAVLRAEQKASDSFRAVLGDFSGVESIRKSEISGIMGMLGQLINVPKKYERAIEAVLGMDLLCLTIETYDQAEEVLSFAQKEESGPLGLVVTEGINKKSAQISLGEGSIPAGDIIKCDNDLKKAMQYLLDSVFIVPDIKAALKLLRQQGKKNGKYVLVTENGEVFHSDGKIYTGFRQKLLKTLGKQNQQEFQSEQKKYLEEQQKIEEKSLTKLDGKKILIENLGVCTKTLKEHEFALQACQVEQKRLEDEIIKTKAERKDIADELDLWKSKIENENKAVAESEEKISKSRQQIDKLDNELNDVVKKKQIGFEERKEIEQQIMQTNLEIDALRGQEDYMAKQTALIDEDQTELQALLDSERELQKSFDQFDSRLTPLKKVFSELLNAVESCLAKTALAIANSKSVLKELKEKLDLKGEKSSNLREEVGTQTERIQNIRVLKAQLEVEVKSISQKIVEEFELPLDKAIEGYQTDKPIRDLKAEINQLRQQIKNMGAVNPIAIDDFNQLKKRQAFLADQIADLTESRKALEKVAGAIDRKIKERFLKTFQEVNFHFQSIFSYLFKGGESELTLDQPEDALNSGVSLNVHPAGKRLQKVTLLSGGEAALVALAFLFAIHHTRPSPFYILDEVEPSLDSINLQRFTAFVRSQSEKTQFLIITHQKRTMEIADLLYGVSMDLDGVSSVISQKLNEFPDDQNGRVYATQ